MCKYDFELDMYSKNSLALIGKKVEKKSKVLEFGPAYGRLTKYLKNEKECTITIVEYDVESGERAKNYADNWYLGIEEGDIEKYYWCNNKEKFDYIIFADVLEHLYNPKEVLKKCKEHLSEKGSILVSIPNIAHNSIIIDLINDRFSYTNTGLLDDTHIRFFTYHSFMELIKALELITVSEQAIYSRVGQNEIRNSYDMVDLGIAKGLKNRDKGNIYQYIFELKDGYIEKNLKCIKTVKIDKVLDYEFICYIKEENDFNYCEEKTLRKRNIIGNEELYLDLKSFNKIEGIRIDPINTDCVIKIIKICTIKNDEYINIPIESTNAIYTFDDVYYFDTNDPQIYLNVKDFNLDNITIKFQIMNLDDRYALENNFILEKLKNLSNENIILNNNTQKNQLELNKKDQLFENLRVDLETKMSLMESLDLELKNKSITIEELYNENNEKDIMIEKLYNKSDEKDIMIKNLKNNIKNIEHKLQETRERLIDKENEIDKLLKDKIRLEMNIKNIEQSKVYKIIKKLKMINNRG